MCLKMSHNSRKRFSLKLNTTNIFTFVFFCQTILTLNTHNKQRWLNLQHAGLRSEKSEFKPRRGQIITAKFFLSVSGIVSYILYYKWCIVHGIPMATVSTQDILPSLTSHPHISMREHPCIEVLQEWLHYVFCLI